jgi:dGTPase
VREYFENLELDILAEYAVKSSLSKGKQYPEPQCSNRTIFQRDRDRIVHSKAFRRLKHKTQVFIATESDHYRSRLTHTLEVAQISRHLARLLRLNEDLAESIALAHDLGHTPFGHSGEKVLNDLMKNFGGFEHNLQSRRIVDELEDKYPAFRGLNLSFELREGLVKHKTAWDNPNSGEQHYVTLEAQVCNIADEIAYNNHDLDDGLASRILKERDLDASVELWQKAKQKVKAQYSNLESFQRRHLINSLLISTQIMDVVNTSRKTLADKAINSLDDIQDLKEDVVSFSAEMKSRNQQLRLYLFNGFYSHCSVYRMNNRGQSIIKGLYDAFTNDINLLPDRYKNRINKGELKERVCADYIAGMTDIYAQKEYETIY